MGLNNLFFQLTGNRSFAWLYFASNIGVNDIPFIIVLKRQNV